MLKDYAVKTSDDLYTLADSRYKDLRVWEFRYTPSQRAQVIADSTKVFDTLDIPVDHAYRRNLIDPKIKKAEADAAAAEKEAKRRAIADAEAAEKAAADRAASERLAAERAAEQAKAKQAATVAARRAPTAAAAVPSPNSHAPATSMLQKVTKIGTANAAAKKQRSASSSSTSSTEAKPVVAPQTARQSASPHAKRTDSDDGYSSSNGPITSSSRGRLKANPTTARTKSTSPNPSRLGMSSAVASPPIGAVGSGSNSVTKKRKLPTSRASTPGTSSPSNGVSIRTKRVAVGQSTTPTPVAATATGSPATPVPAKLPSPPRPPRAGPDEDMFALADMFRQKYSIYEKLYRHVSTNSEDDQRRLRKLLSLHRELESVKKKLWSMSPPGSAAAPTAGKKQATQATGPIKNSSRLR